MNRKEKATDYFSSGYNCSQAVLGAFEEDLGLDKETLLKLTSGFGSGLKRGEVCGAVTGAIMVIGFKHGYCNIEDVGGKEKATKLTKEFETKFEEANGSIICKEILGYDLTKEEDMKVISQKGLFTSVCPEAVKSAVDILEKMLEKNN